MQTESNQASIEAVLSRAEAALAAGSDTPRLDAELLLAKVLERPRSHFRAWPENPVDPESLASFDELLARRVAGEPVAYLLGERAFWTLDLDVTSDTLIPRPDTERLVEAAIERIPSDSPCRVVDLGTGSGALALAIARERPFADVVAVDKSIPALEIARRNAARNNISNVSFMQSDWWQDLAGETFDIVVSNPPYIRTGDPHLATGDVRFEPRSALVAGEDGLDAIRAILAEIHAHLRPGGWLLFEHGHDQGDAITAMLASEGLENIRCLQDLGGNDRVSIGQIPGQMPGRNRSRT